jgi:hypothetical protein
MNMGNPQDPNSKFQDPNPRSKFQEKKAITQRNTKEALRFTKKK